MPTTNESLLDRCRGSNVSMEHLFASLCATRNRLESMRPRASAVPALQPVISLCDEKLQKVEEALCPSGSGRKMVFLAWSLLHRVSEELVLCYDAPELAADGQTLLDAVKTSPMPDSVRADWVLRIQQANQDLKATPGMTGAQLRQISELFRSAWNVVNSSVDDKFWDIWSKRFISLIYAALLAVALLLFVALLWRRPFDPRCLWAAALLGGLGGLASGVLSGDQEYLAKGHFWIPTLYYALVRPTLGAMAGIATFWMLQAHFIFSIQVQPDKTPATVGTPAPPPPTVPAQGQPALPTGPKVPAIAPEKPVASPAPATPKPPAKAPTPGPEEKQAGTAGSGPAPEPKTQTGASTPGTGTAEQAGLIVLRTTPAGEPYLFSLLLFLAGFSGDKLLKAISDRVMSRLFAEAEKGKAPPAK